MTKICIDQESYAQGWADAMTHLAQTDPVIATGPLPQAIYTATIVSASEGTSAGGRPLIKLEMHVQYLGETYRVFSNIVKRFYLDTGHAKVFELLPQLCTAAGFNGSVPPVEEFVGKTVRISTSIAEYRSRQSTQVESFLLF